MSHEALKLDLIIRTRFMRMYGDKSSLNTAEIKDWGAFLSERGIAWEIKLNKRPNNWSGWDIKEGKGCLIAKPEGLDDHIRVNHYFVPRELALKMLVFGELP